MHKNSIGKYLSEIDKKYGTSYCPEGTTRINNMDKNIQKKKEVLGLFLKERFKEKNISLREFMRRTSLNSTQVKDLFEGGANYSINTFLKALEVLDLRITFKDSRGN